MRNSLRHHGLLRANCANQFLQALAFGVEHAFTEGRQPVIAAARVVEFRGRPFVGFLDQVGLDEPLDRSIEGCWPQTYFSGGAIQDFLHDSVAVLLSSCKGEHDVKPMGLQREEFLGVSHNDIYIIRYLYVSIGFEGPFLRSPPPGGHRRFKGSFAQRWSWAE